MSTSLLAMPTSRDCQAPFIPRMHFLPGSSPVAPLLPEVLACAPWAPQLMGEVGESWVFPNMGTMLGKNLRVLVLSFILWVFHIKQERSGSKHMHLITVRLELGWAEFKFVMGQYWFSCASMNTFHGLDGGHLRSRLPVVCQP